MNLQRNWGGRPLAVKAEQKCVHIFGNEGRSEMWNYRSFAVKAEGKCGGGTSHIWQWRQSVSGEADLQIFGIERKCRSETVNLRKSRQRWDVEAELHIFVSPGRKSAESGTSDLCQSRQSRSTEAELHIFGSQGRAEVRKRNFTFFGSQCRTKVRTWNFRSLAVKTERKRNFRSLAVKAERKCGSRSLGLWQSRQSRSVEAEFQIFSRQDRAEVWKQHCRSLTVQSSWTCGSGS